MNTIHPTLKLTLNHTTPKDEAEKDRCNCNPRISIPFLDTSLTLIDGKIDTRHRTGTNPILERGSAFLLLRHAQATPPGF